MLIGAPDAQCKAPEAPQPVLSALSLPACCVTLTVGPLPHAWQGMKAILTTLGFHTAGLGTDLGLSPCQPQLPSEVTLSQNSTSGPGAGEWEECMCSNHCTNKASLGPSRDGAGFTGSWGGPREGGAS